MEVNEWKQLVAIPIILAVAIGIAIAGSVGGSTAFRIPVFLLGVIIAFALQWIAFIPAYWKRTEKYYDLTGSLAYLTVTMGAYLLSTKSTRSLILTIIVAIWTTRLGLFLFKRIKKSGEDSRFEEIKKSAIRFFTVWTIQGLWVSLTLAAALAAITSETKQSFGIIGIVGVLIWVIGFSIEVIADWQKSNFKKNPDNEGDFIHEGLWAWSRHPNYFGEIVLWIGVAVIALPVLQGWQYITLISPVFVILLLTKVSGIPLLEEKADDRWGGQEDYEDYKSNTPVLIPRPPSS